MPLGCEGFVPRALLREIRRFCFYFCDDLLFFSHPPLPPSLGSLSFLVSYLSGFLLTNGASRHLPCAWTCIHTHSQNRPWHNNGYNDARPKKE